NARGVAIMHVAMFEAANAVTRRYSPYRLQLAADKGTSAEAAAVSAAHAVLTTLHPDQQASLDVTLQATLGKIAEGDAKANGIKLGRQAAEGILALRASDGASAAEQYRPVTAPGVYVSTVLPVSSTIGQVTPWVMTS